MGCVEKVKCCGFREDLSPIGNAARDADSHALSASGSNFSSGANPPEDEALKLFNTAPLMEPEIILGSQSPRRRAILSAFQLPFRQVAPHYNEEAVPFKGDPQQYVLTIAEGKAASLAPHFPGIVLITADSTVYCNGKIHAKPSDAEDAFRMLSELVGRTHSVFSGVIVRRGNTVLKAVEETQVTFNPLTDQQIRDYHKSMHCYDKCGGYTIQGSGSLLVKQLSGCYYNILGLPVNALQRLLLEVHIDLWKHLKSTPG